MSELAKGRNVLLVVDGIAGMFYGPVHDHSTGRTRERLWLTQRKAIVAIALQCGADIVPGYGSRLIGIWFALDRVRVMVRAWLGIWFALG